MIPYVIAAVVGASVMGRTKPNGKVEKTTCFGPRSGVTYRVDVLEGLGLYVMIAPDGTKAAFKRLEDGKMLLVQGLGDERVVRLMQKDFESPDKEDSE